MLTKIINHVRGQYLGAIALFIALGGTSYAAIKLPAGSVGSKQLRNGSVTPPKLSSAIAGHIAMWAQVRANGSVVSSRPHAKVVAFAIPGRYQVTWPRAVSSKCTATANAVNVLPPGATAGANVTGPYPRKGSTFFVVTTFNGGGTVSDPFNVVVICP
jgi:hypothetical protein